MLAELFQRFPILLAIPDGAEVTLHLRNGSKLHGYESTRMDDYDAGLIRLENQPAIVTRVFTVLASEVVAVEIATE